MIKFETHTGNDLGTLKRTSNGKLVCSTPAVEELVDSKRQVYGLSDEEIYEWFRRGSLDNGYVKATEVAAA